MFLFVFLCPALLLESNTGRPESLSEGGGGGGNFDNVLLLLFFQFDEGRKNPNTTISGQSSARQRNAI